VEVPRRAWGGLAPFDMLHEQAVLGIFGDDHAGGAHRLVADQAEPATVESAARVVTGIAAAVGDKNGQDLGGEEDGCGVAVTVVTPSSTAGGTPDPKSAQPRTVTAIKATPAMKMRGCVVVSTVGYAMSR